jgi:hypothetical protein
MTPVSHRKIRGRITRLKLNISIRARSHSTARHGKGKEPEKTTPQVPLESPTYDPTPEDIAWLNDQPTAEDWREYGEWCREFDARLEALRMERDAPSEFPGVIPPGLARFLAYGNIHE